MSRFVAPLRAKRYSNARLVSKGIVSGAAVEAVVWSEKGVVTLFETGAGFHLEKKEKSSEHFCLLTQLCSSDVDQLLDSPFDLYSANDTRIAKGLWLVELGAMESLAENLWRCNASGLLTSIEQES